MDRDLIIRAREGDRDAFARLAAGSIDQLDAVARLITRDPERAKDAVQETLIRAWRDLPGLREPDRFEAWLRRLLVRASIDEVRRHRRWPIEVELVEVHHPRIADPMAGVADRDSLERGFRRLDPEGRAVIVLYHYLDLPLDEIARSIGVPVGTVKSRLHRARATLRAALDADARAPAVLREGRYA